MSPLTHSPGWERAQSKTFSLRKGWHEILFADWVPEDFEMRWRVPPVLLHICTISPEISEVFLRELHTPASTPVPWVSSHWIPPLQLALPPNSDCPYYRSASLHSTNAPRALQASCISLRSDAPKLAAPFLFVLLSAETHSILPTMAGFSDASRWVKIGFFLNVAGLVLELLLSLQPIPSYLEILQCLAVIFFFLTTSLSFTWGFISEAKDNKGIHISTLVFGFITGKLCLR